MGCQSLVLLNGDKDFSHHQKWNKCSESQEKEKNFTSERAAIPPPQRVDGYGSKSG